ncbi:hypothetical protein [Caudoviricetes sp.]|nr:hypothetical protein [Caudoviricetes sp.]
MLYETQEDLYRETKAIEHYVKLFKGSYKKLDKLDIDFKIFDENNLLIGYAEVKGRNKIIADAYPLVVSVKKLSKLMDKRLNPTIIWACLDGIIYGKVQYLKGEIKYGGSSRSMELSDKELMAYFDKQPQLKYFKYD